MGNLDLYDRVRAVPETAKKPIAGGRLKGKTDINPMWRIKALTEQFGPCGKGWSYTIKNREFVPGSNGEISVFVDIDLVVLHESGEWSKPIPGVGGSMYVVKESSGLYTDDEAPKKALTDAIGVACKALGVGADVYWEKDATKYTTHGQDASKGRTQHKPSGTSNNGDKPTEEQIIMLCKLAESRGYDQESVIRLTMTKYGLPPEQLSITQYTETWTGYQKLHAKVSA